MITAFMIAFCAWLHRWRGGGWPKIDLPGGPAIAPSLLLGFVCWPLFGWAAALIAGGGYLFANVFGHGAYIDMGRSAPDDEISWIDWIVRPWLGDGWQGDAAGLFLRHLYAFPFFAAMSWLNGSWAQWAYVLPFALAATAVYVIAFRLLYPKRFGLQATEWAEYGVGIIWGLSIAGAAYGA